FAADHVISDVRGFRRAITHAVAAAETGRIALVGITPTEPAIGFGYIRAGESVPIPDAPAASQVLSFGEKPDLATARRYLADGGYLW
ncbi:sugar phosphate nucleotidyltransferase, partial [Mesorhizobium japonicum]|uniref:sugar phosphate nucleotidyltransferase n=1 Tax=Mesorhizobium japonicum TaxID=2066070 RepID=UPI003B5C5A03